MNPTDLNWIEKPLGGSYISPVGKISSEYSEPRIPTGSGPVARLRARDARSVAVPGEFGRCRGETLLVLPAAPR